MELEHRRFCDGNGKRKVNGAAFGALLPQPNNWKALLFSPYILSPTNEMQFTTRQRRGRNSHS